MKWLRILPLICALPVHADIHVLNNLDATPQEHSFWCWAAVSSVAISAFDEVDGLVHLPQVDVVARRRARVSTLVQERLPGKAQAIVDEKKKCTDTPDLCDKGDEPLLFDIDSDPPPSGKALSMDAFRMEIDRNRPVIIRWMYSSLGAPGADAIFGTHALIVTGYDSNKNKLQIFDPLPLSKTRGARHTFWIPISQYQNPFVQQGRQVCPMHRSDQFRMRRTSGRESAPAMGSYPMVDATTPCPPGPPPGGFTPQKELEGIINTYVNKQWKEGEFLDQNGEAWKGIVMPGKAFAVVAPGAANLLDPRGRSPESLLVRHANAYVVPLLHGGDVVDSFQLLPENGTWKPGGYSNAEIANLLLRLSTSDQKELTDGNDEFYLVSIPELAAFYIAHGFKDAARLKSLDYGGKGSYLPANQVLGKLVQRVRRLQEQARATPRMKGSK